MVTLTANGNNKYVRPGKQPKIARVFNRETNEYFKTPSGKTVWMRTGDAKNALTYHVGEDEAYSGIYEIIKYKLNLESVEILCKNPEVDEEND